MVFEQFVDVDIGYAIAIGGHENIIIDVAKSGLDARAGQGLDTGILDADAPVQLLARIAQPPVLAAGEINLDVGSVLLIVQEVVLDHVAAVAGAESNELILATRGSDAGFCRGRVEDR